MKLLALIWWMFAQRTMLAWCGTPYNPEWIPRHPKVLQQPGWKIRFNMLTALGLTGATLLCLPPAFSLTGLMTTLSYEALPETSDLQHSLWNHLCLDPSGPWTQDAEGNKVPSSGLPVPRVILFLLPIPVAVFQLHWGQVRRRRLKAGDKLDFDLGPVRVSCSFAT